MGRLVNEINITKKDCSDKDNIFCWNSLSKYIGHFLKPTYESSLFSLSQITDKKILVSEWICIGKSVITLVDKRPKNRLQLILIIHKKYIES